jgi:peptidoglycan/LPS O-acetylase OafA/YrhL
VRPSYRPDIDGLRALSVLAVMWFHLVPQAHQGLILSVDMFFVISGYLITSTQLRGGSLGAFYAGRVRRMFPALLVVLCAGLLFATLTWEPRGLRNMAREVIASGLFAQNFLLASEVSYFDLATFERPFLHLWTLAVEEQFYVVWPLFLMIASALPIRRVALIVLGLCAVFLGITLGLTFFRPSAGHYYLPWMRLWALLAGSALALFEARGATALAASGGSGGSALPTWLATLAASSGILLAGVGVVVVDAANHLKGGVVLGVAATLLIIAAGRQSLINRALLSLRPLVWIGLISYPLYLWHWLLKILWLHSDWRFALEVSGVITRRRGYGLEIFEAAGIACLSLGLAGLTWYVVERPLRRQPIRPRLWGSLVAGMAAVIVFALWVRYDDGLAWRIPESHRSLLIDAEREQADYRLGTCFLARGEDLPRALNPTSDCVDPAQPGRPTVLLWGDSHAAHFVTGLRPLMAARGIGFAQLTVAACAPHYRPAPEWCTQVQAAQWAWVRNLKPDLVVLAAAWAQRSPTHVDDVVRELEALGTRAIVLGPVPAWLRPLPTLLQREVLWETAHAGGSTPTDTTWRSYGLQPGGDALDRAVRDAVTAAKVISVYDRLCKPGGEGCVATSGGIPVSWDQAHLSVAGARFIAPFLAEVIEQALEQRSGAN